MDVTKLIAELHRELEGIDRAIVALERLKSSHAKRGRPPKSLADETSAARPGAGEEGAGGDDAPREHRGPSQ
jgi:hypothetical protein